MANLNYFYFNTGKKIKLITFSFCHCLNNTLNLIFILTSHSRQYPEIISDKQRRQYKKEFDSDLALYKSLCAEMDDISDQMHKLSRELDVLDEGSMKYQVEKNRREVRVDKSRASFLENASS